MSIDQINFFVEVLAVNGYSDVDIQNLLQNSGDYNFQITKFLNSKNEIIYRTPCITGARSFIFFRH